MERAIAPDTPGRDGVSRIAASIWRGSGSMNRLTRMFAPTSRST